MGSKEERASLPVITFLCALHSLDHSEVFTELYREEEREEVDRGGQEDKRGKLKGERQIQPVTSSLSVLHRLEHRDSQRWVEKRRGKEETETTWWRKRRVQRRREWSSQ